LDGERKSIQPLSGRVPGGDEQRLQQFINQSPWDAAPILREYRACMAEVLAGENGLIVIDDTGFAKQGKHSVGVKRQYSGTLGKVGNCQVAVSLHYANGEADYPLALRLYLPDVWTNDLDRLAKARVPEAERGFKPKWEIALDLLDMVREEGLPTLLWLPMLATGRASSVPGWRLEANAIWLDLVVRRQYSQTRRSGCPQRGRVLAAGHPHAPIWLRMLHGPP